MIIQKFIDIFGTYLQYVKIFTQFDLEKYAKWRLRRVGKEDIKFNTLKSGLVALRLEVVNADTSARMQDLSNGYHYVKTSLYNPLSLFEYTIDHGRLIRDKVQYPFITWLKEQFFVWLSLLGFALIVIVLYTLNGQIAHYFIIIVGALIFILGLFLSVPNPPKRSPNYPLISFIPFLIVGLLVVTEVLRPNLLLASTYTEQVSSILTDIQATSDSEKMLIITADNGKYIVNGGNLYINTPIKIQKFYFDSQKEKVAIIFLCDKTDQCITASEPEVL